MAILTTAPLKLEAVRVLEALRIEKETSFGALIPYSDFDLRSVIPLKLIILKVWAYSHSDPV
jgi:hypothetical protein